MLKKLIIIAAVALVAVMINGRGVSALRQDVLVDFKDNHCVECHSKLTVPFKVTSKYSDWHISTHREKGVGCEKCHGGDATAKDAGKAHIGLLPASDPNSPVNTKKLPETCVGCHKGVVEAFVKSKHFQNLKGTGLGPSCNVCHGHMVTETAYLPEQTSKLCASCHDSNNALMPKRPDIPVKVEEVVQAIRRANTVVLWAGRLVDQAQEKKMSIAGAAKDLKEAQVMMSDAKAGFHSFELDAVRTRADAAFENATKLKDSLRKQLYPGQ